MKLHAKTVNMCTQVKQHKSQLDPSYLNLHIPHPTHKPQATPTFPSLLFNFILTILFPLLSLQIIYHFLSYCQCPPKEIYGVKFLDQKLLPFATIQFKWYSYRIKICSNEPLQFQLSSTFTMHILDGKYLGALSSIQVTLYSVELSTYLHTCITVSYIYCSLFLFLPLDLLPIIVVFTYCFYQYGMCG